MPPEETPQSPDNLRERGRLWLRGVVLVAIGMLLVGDLAIYSLYQALASRVEGQDHRIERLQQMVSDMIKANQNAEKIQKIETQVEGIEVQVTELTTTLKAEAAEAKAEQESKKKKRR